MSFLSALIRCVQQPWARDLGMVLVLTLAAICVGGWILDRWRIATPQITALERMAFSAAAGFAALVIMASAMGVVRLFHPLPLRILLAAFTIAGLLRLPQEVGNFRAFGREIAGGLRQEPLAGLPIAITAVFCWFALICAAAPEIACDAIFVYLPYPQEFLRRGTFSLIELYRGNIPLYGVVYFALGEVLHNDHLRAEAGARMMNYLTLPGLLLATAALAHTVCEKLARPVFYTSLAVCWVATCPVLWYHATISYPDLGVALWSTLALQATLRLLESRQREAPIGNWAAMVGLSAGMAAGIKFSGLYWMILCAILIFAGYMLFPYRRFPATDGGGSTESGGEIGGIRARLRQALTVVVIFGLIGSAVCLPWLIRNWINTGDPMHPLFQHLLRHPAIDLNDAKSVLANGLNGRGLPFSLRSLLAIPWWMTFGSDRFVGTIGPVLLWTLPILVLGWRREREWLLLSAALLLFGLFWLQGPQWCRYFLPAIPLAAALGASALANLRFPRWLSVYMAGLALLMVLPNLPEMNDSLAPGTEGIPDRVLYETALGLQDQQEYRQRNLDLYEASQAANALNLPASTGVLAVPMTATLPSWHTRYHLLDVWDNLRLVCTAEDHSDVPCYSITGEALARRLDRAGVGLLFIRHTDEWLATGLGLEDATLRKSYRLSGYGGGVFFYERDRLAPRPGQIYVETDLMRRWALGLDSVSSVPAGQPHKMQEVRGHRDGVRQTLSFNSNTATAVLWKVKLGNRAALSFSFVRKEWSDKSAGDLIVSVDKEVVADVVLREQDPIDRWRQVDVDLSRWNNGQTVTLTLELHVKQPGALVELQVADPVIYAREEAAPKIEATSAPSAFDEATIARPVAVSFSPSAIRAGETYTMSLPQPATEWAGQWVDVLIACGNQPPTEIHHFRQLDAQGQVRVAVDPGFAPCRVSVRGVRRSGEERWKMATGSIVVRAPAR
jgi:hypothetical protein